MRTACGWLLRYRLRQFFTGSQPVIPLILTAVFWGSMYSVKPLDVCDSFLLSGILQFFLAVIISRGIAEREQPVEEELLYLRGRGPWNYYFSKELTSFGAMFGFALLLTVIPLIQSRINPGTMFRRALESEDMLLGGLVILSSGIAGCALGSFFHPRLMENRKLALSLTAGAAVVSALTEVLGQTWPVLKGILIVFPGISRLAFTMGNEVSFSAGAVFLFAGRLYLWSGLAAGIRICLLERKRF